MFIFHADLAKRLLTIIACFMCLSTPALAAADQKGFKGIPGVRNCLFRFGPVSADPYINVAYPDAGVKYWGSAFTIPEGAKMEIVGKFPHARYMSLISYDKQGRPVESVADYLIQPVADNVNPFLPGADRTASNRSYQIEVLNAPPSEDYTKAIVQNGETRATIHAPASDVGQQVILYRIYAWDSGSEETGGVQLPKPRVTLADGTVLEAKDACQALNTGQPFAADLSALAVRVNQYRQLLSQPDKPDTHPATEPASWHIQLDREALLGIYTGKVNPDARRSEGGFYPNLDNNYIRTVINRKFGPVFVMRGKAPTSPTTYKGDATMGEGQLRYWSVCSNKGLAMTMVNDCIYDEHIPLRKNGTYVIAISRAADRPRNAYAECGIAWLPMADDGDGLFDPDSTIVQIRHMLADKDFAHAIQKVEVDGDIAKVMGPYYPQNFYTTTNNFELMVPCAPTRAN